MAKLSTTGDKVSSDLVTFTAGITLNANGNATKTIKATVDYRDTYLTVVKVEAATAKLFALIDELILKSKDVASIEGWKKILQTAGDAGSDFWGDAVDTQVENFTIDYHLHLDPKEDGAWVGAKLDLDGVVLDPLKPPQATLDGSCSVELNGLERQGEIQRKKRKDKQVLDGKAAIGIYQVESEGKMEAPSSFDIALLSLFDRIRRQVEGSFSWTRFKALFSALFEGTKELRIKVSKAIYQISVFPSKDTMEAAGYFLVTPKRTAKPAEKAKKQAEETQQRQDETQRQETGMRQAKALESIAVALAGRRTELTPRASTPDGALELTPIEPLVSARRAAAGDTIASFDDAGTGSIRELARVLIAADEARRNLERTAFAVERPGNGAFTVGG